MQFSDDDLKKLGRLARLDLAADERQQLAAEMSGIFGMIDALQAVDTTGVAPMASVVGHGTVLRDDAVTDGDQQAGVTQNAPESAHGFFVVPKVVGGA